MLTAEDIAFFLHLERDGFPDVPLHEATQAARAYRNRMRRKRSSPPG